MPESSRRMYPLIVMVLIASTVVMMWATVPVDFRLGQTWEEDALFYIVGKNFVQNGFWATRLLDDYSVGADPAARPMLYTHFPTISGIIQGLLQACGIHQIRYIKLFFIPPFLAGMLYLYLTMEWLFNNKVALLMLAVTGTNYLGTLVWADNTVHSFHWIFLFGTIFHYFSVPKGLLTRRKDYFHLFMAWLFFFFAGTITYIHVLFLVLVIGLLFLSGIHRTNLSRLAFIMSAPLTLVVLHQIRIISLLGTILWFQDQVLNIKKAMNLVDYKALLDFYSQHGIVVWPSGFQSLSLWKMIKFFWDGLFDREGWAGLAVLLGMLVFSLFSFVSARWSQLTDVDRPGQKILILFIASIAWNVIFPTHGSNYFGATPYMMLSVMISLGWALLFFVITDAEFIERLQSARRTYALVVVLCFSLFSYQRVDAFLGNPITSIPGAEALIHYRGSTFFTNIWPLYVSYYTDGWAAGGLSPQDGIARRVEQARWLLQKDQRNYAKYRQAEYYFHVVDSRMGPYAEPESRKVLEQNLPLVECGPTYCIYKLGLIQRVKGQSDGE
jgi:hypothetical protein